MSLTRTSNALFRMCASCRQLSTLKQYSSKRIVDHQANNFKAFKPQFFMSCQNLSDSVSENPSLNTTDYPSGVEVSYEEFKYVKQLLPKQTVPEIPEHQSFPTPSGWIPPNDELRSKQQYLIRRTKNHVLPVYPVQREVWTRIMHHVVIKNIEGDIWKLESDLRHYLQNITGEKKIITQVHEVSRIIRVRGQHRAAIAEFLLEKGM